MVRPIVGPSPTSSSGPSKWEKRVGKLAGKEVTSSTPTAPKPAETAAKIAAVPLPSPPAQKKQAPPLPPMRKSIGTAPKEAVLPSPPAQKKPLKPVAFTFQKPDRKPPLPPTPTMKPAAAPVPGPSPKAAQPAKPISLYETEQAVLNNDFKEAFKGLTELSPRGRQTLYENIGEKRLISFFREMLVQNLPIVTTLAFAFEAFREDTFRNAFLPTDKKNLIFADEHDLQELADLIYDDNDIQKILGGLEGTNPPAFKHLDALAEKAPLDGLLHFLVKSETNPETRKAILAYAEGRSELAPFAAKLKKSLETGKWPS